MGFVADRFLCKMIFSVIKVSLLKGDDENSQHNIHQPRSKHNFAKNCILFDIPITQ